MASINTLPNVAAATRPKGSSSDNWFKVYCSGAPNWKRSTHTSDSGAHDVYAVFKTADTNTLELSARSTKHLVDRIVLHRESVADSVARDAKLSETACN